MSTGILHRAALSLACVLILTGLASAQGASSHPVEGTYIVTATGSEIGSVQFTLALKRVADKWTGEITDSPLPLTIKSVVLEPDNKITITASTGDAEVKIIGKLDGEKLAGDWTAGEAKGTWTGARKAAVATTAAAGAPAPATAPAAAAAPPAAAAAPLSAATIAALEGTYDATVTAEGQGSLPFTLVLKKSGDKLAAEAQNAGDLAITGIEVNGDAVILNASFQGNPFALPGKITGTEMAGKWEAGGFSGTWTAKKKAN